MPPKKEHSEEPINQGMLFPVDFSRLHPPEIGEVVEGGVFPDELEPTTESDEQRHMHEVVHEAVVAEQQKRTRREAQLGKHSPLERSGTYLDVRPGDVLPGFGVVKDRNYDNAKNHARRLEAQRLAKLAQQPTLTGPSKAEVADAIEEVADKLDIRKGIEADKPETTARQVGHIALNADKRRAFGSVPGLLRDRSIDKTNIETLTADDYARVDPEFLRKSYLVKNAEWSYNGIALTQEEFSKVLLNPKTFTERVAALVSRGHTLSNPIRRAEVKISGPMHAYEDLSKKHEGIVKGLDAQRARLVELAQEARAPGFAHKTEVDLIMLAQEAWQLGFKTLLQTAARTNNFSIEQAEAMEWALYDKLIHGPQRDKIAYWQDMLAVTAEYTNRRRLTMISSKHRVDSEARKLKKQLDAFSDEHGTLR